MLYALRFDAALRALGLAPETDKRLERDQAMGASRARGDTPQEAVLCAAAARGQRSRRMSNTLRDWVLQGKLDLNKPHVHTAFHWVCGTDREDSMRESATAEERR